MNVPSVCILIPLFNGKSTIIKTLESLMNQDFNFDELIIINDGSTDNSGIEVERFFLNHKIKPVIINNKISQGLARTYNEGVKISKSDLIITLHQDVLIQNKNSLRLLVDPFLKNERNNIVASTHKVIHPKYIWDEYNFWQKCFFDRLLCKEFSGIDGKFDCFSKKALVKVGLFDEVHFKNAGEDGDMIYKLNRIGKVAQTDATIIHLHKNNLNFGVKDLFHKQAQYSEAQGALLRLGRVESVRKFIQSFFREILIILLFIPIINIMAALLIILYSFGYTKNVYLDKFDWRKPVLPFVNVGLLFVSLIYSLKGFMYGKQKI